MGEITETHICGVAIPDLQEKIDLHILTFCRTHPYLQYEQVKDDASQEVWMRILKVASAYEDMGFRFETFVWPHVRWVLSTFAKDHRKYTARYELMDWIAEDSFQRPDQPDMEGLLKGIPNADVLLLYLSGFYIHEIETLYPGREVSLKIIEEARELVKERLLNE